MPRQPNSPLVSDAIRFRVSDGQLATQLQSALAAIDEVHSDGLLLPVDVSDFLQSKDGEFGGYHRGKISMARGLSEPLLVFVHEVAHMLADRVFRPLHPPAGFHAGAEGRPLDFQYWFRAVKTSKAYKNIIALISEVGMPEEDNAEEIRRLSELRYLKDEEELWARSYSQFIALKSSNSQLKAEFHQRRQANRFEYWTDQDFTDIKKAINSIMQHRGWR